MEVHIATNLLAFLSMALKIKGKEINKMSFPNFFYMQNVIKNRAGRDG